MGNWAPSAGQVVAKLEREARAIAERLGHTWTGIAPGIVAGEFVTHCAGCFAWAKITPRDFTAIDICGELVTFRCKVAAEFVAKCRHCGGTVSTWQDKLCRAPDRMGPCEK